MRPEQCCFLPFQGRVSGLCPEHTGSRCMTPFLFKSCSLYTAANLELSAFVMEVINMCELGMHFLVWKCTKRTSVSGVLFPYIFACSCGEMWIPVETFLHDSHGLNFLCLAQREISVSRTTYIPYALRLASNAISRRSSLIYTLNLLLHYFSSSSILRILLMGQACCLGIAQWLDQKADHSMWDDLAGWTAASPA